MRQEFSKQIEYSGSRVISPMSSLPSSRIFEQTPELSELQAQFRLGMITHAANGLLEE